MPTKKNDKPVVRIASFDVLKPEDIDVQLVFDDHVEVVPLRTLSYAEFQRLGQEVPNPVPPVMSADRSGPILDYNDKTYRQAVYDANLLRAYKRLLAMLLIPVPGKTEAEKIATLESMDANRLRMLIDAVTQLAAGGEAVVESRAATFQRQ